MFEPRDVITEVINNKQVKTAENGVLEFKGFFEPKAGDTVAIFKSVTGHSAGVAVGANNHTYWDSGSSSTRVWCRHPEMGRLEFVENDERRAAKVITHFMDYPKAWIDYAREEGVLKNMGIFTSAEDVFSGASPIRRAI